MLAVELWFRIKSKLLLFQALLAMASFPSIAEVTPSRVYSEVKALHGALSKYSNTQASYPRMQILGAQPLHVYAMATALNEKLAILIDIAGLDSKSVGRPGFPEGNIEPKHVLELVKTIQSNFLLLAPDSGFRPSRVSNKAPTDVLRLILACNLIVDSMLKGTITPNYPYSLVSRLKTLLESLTEVKAPSFKSELYNKVLPAEVFIVAESISKILINTAHLTLKDKYPNKPYFNLLSNEDIRPVDVFTLTVFNWVLLMDITHYAEPPAANYIEVKKKSPADVYAVYQQVFYLTGYFLLSMHEFD